jgi:hypothetical protein
MLVLVAAALLLTSSDVGAAVLPRTDVSTLSTPFTLVTTQSTSFPVVSTGSLSLYYPGYTSGASPGLNLFSQTSFAGTQLNITGGVLGTVTRPDDAPGSLPWNATTPSSGGLVTFEPQYAAHAG